MLIALSLSITTAGAIIFFSRRLLCYLRHFQEVGYRNKEFKDWMLANGIYDKKGSLISALAALTIELTKEEIVISLAISTVAVAGLVWLSFTEDDPQKTGTFKLRPTRKALSIYHLALSLYSILLTLGAICLYAFGSIDDPACYWLVVIIGIQSSPIWMVIAGKLSVRA